MAPYKALPALQPPCVRASKAPRIGCGAYSRHSGQTPQPNPDNCDEPIGLGRLMADPAAQLCLDYAEAAEK